MPWKHRYSVLAVLFCAYLLCYLDRMVIASAIPFIAADLHLSPMVVGQVLSWRSGFRPASWGEPTACNWHRPHSEQRWRRFWSRR